MIKASLYTAVLTFRNITIKCVSKSMKGQKDEGIKFLTGAKICKLTTRLECGHAFMPCIEDMKQTKK